MKKSLTLLTILILIIIGFMAYTENQKDVVVIQAPILEVEDVSENPTTEPLIIVENILPNQTITNPVTIKGKARGYWFFEASFPAKIVDANDVELAVFPVTTDEEWMTEEYVNFEITVPFATSTTATGKIILEKDNPSGDPENDDSLIIPVNF